mgnify:CR=1 FL=1
MAFEKIGLSFIGTGEYSETNYQYEGKSCKTNLFSNAFSTFIDFEKVFLAMTEKAKEKHINSISLDCNYEIIDIPIGKTEDELWSIFDSITKKIPEECSLSIDVTHAFRSLPMIGLSIAVYLRKAKNVEVNSILYGAYEARNTENNETPVFDLTSFLELIDWSVATNQFIKHGNASYLKEILSGIHRNSYVNNLPYKPQALANIGNQLNELSEALSLARIKEAQEISSRLPKLIESSKTDINNINKAIPFQNLVQRIPDRFNQLLNSGHDLFSKQGFMAQINMVNFYLDTENYMQAITLSREMIVSLICSKEKKDPLDLNERKSIESTLFCYTQLLKENKIRGFDKELAEIWEKVTDIRNDICHNGMRKGSSNKNTAIKSVKEKCNLVINLISKYFNDDK